MPSDALHNLAQLISQPIAPQLDEEQWLTLVNLAGLHGLAPYLWWGFKDEIIHLPPQTVELLKTKFQQSAGRWLALEHTQGHIQAVLDEHQIPVLWLKGIALAPTIYPSPATRPMADIDVLVSREHYAQALQILQQTGYQGDTSSLNPYATKHFTLTGGADHSLIIEVHHTLFDENDPQSPSAFAWFWAQRTNTHPLTLTPAAHLLYLAAHALLYHGEIEFFLQRFFDMHLLITQTEIDWDVVLNHAIHLKWTYPVERTLMICQEYFATPLPPDILTQLAENRPADEDVVRVQRFQSVSPATERILTRLGQLPPRERIQHIWQILFPPREYMRQRYTIPPTRAVLWYYPYRSGQMLWKLGHWLIQRWQLKRKP